jgi:hypothetical protein
MRALRWKTEIPRRTCVGTLVLGCALLTLIDPDHALAADRITVQATILSDHIHLAGQYWIQKPKSCPAMEPKPANTAAVRAWHSPHCRMYKEQSADVEVRVLHDGVFVYAGSHTGFGDASPLNGASIDTNIYVFQLAGGSSSSCPGGTYTWVVTLIDPYFRPNYNTSARGSFRCG